ncbi:MAG: GNAT family N-acetyltransferase [Planctomycetes bacterium]|nr:GNAT family N-acetyltransferase [Planctomycetota bacterium]
MARFDVSPAAPHELLPACRLLFADGRAEHCCDRLLSDARTSGLFVARDATDRLHAAALVQSLPGALGVAWAPRGDSAKAIDAATVAACEWLRSHGVKVCQAFATAGEVADMIALERLGFRRTTQLVFMQRDCSPTGLPATDPARSLSFVADGLPFSREFATTLLATHQETRDCPELNAPRTAEELLEGFGASANGETYLVRRGEVCVGVVMFEPGAAPEVAELTYIGIVPDERGSGLGGELLKFVATETSAAGHARLNVSVDARNAPAMKLYTRHGFVEYDRREVWLATWRA